MKVKVNEGWQLGDDDGNPAQPGDVVDVSKDTADQWIAAGMAVKVKAAAKSKSKAVTTSKNKVITEAPNKTTFTSTIKPE